MMYSAVAAIITTQYLLRFIRR